KGNIGFNYKIINERMLYPGALTAQQVRQNRRQSQTDTDFFKNWNGLFHFKEQHEFANQWHFDFDASRREMHGSGVFSPSNFLQSRYIYFLKPQLKKTFNKTTVTSGADF